MSFDFKEYLAKLYPAQAYSISPLAGGFVNVSVRATRVNSTAASPADRHNDTIILKYAPPYVAGRGEAAPMTQWRQTIEARALRLVQHLALGGCKVQVPQVLRHDVEVHILAITDLGALPNLQELFYELGGYTTFNGVPDIIQNRFTGSVSELKSFSNIGRRLGEFFALLHSPGTLQWILSNPDLGQDYLSNPDLETAVVDITMQAREDQLKQFPDLLPKPPDRLFQTIREDILRSIEDDEKSFVLGDCWPAAVLVGFDARQPEPEIGVIDWEFAKIGRGLHGDMAQLLAHFELFRIAAEHQGKSAYTGIIDTTVHHLMRSYAGESARQHARWTQQSRQRHVYHVVLRSAFLAQACEMVNCTFWKVWHCEDPTCALDDDTHTTIASDCVLIKKMIARAVTYLELAQWTAADLAEPTHWRKRLLEEKQRNGGWGLFELLIDE